VDEDTASEKPPPFWAALLWMTLYLALTNVGIIAIAHTMVPQHNGLAKFGIWILQLILILGLTAWVNGKTGGRGLLFVLVIGFSVYSLVYGLMLGHIPRLFALRETPLIPVRDAARPEYFGFDVYHFSDGKVGLKYVSHRTLAGKNGRSHYYLAPLLPPDWKRGDRIPAWVGESDLGLGVPEYWTEDWRGGYRIGLDSKFEDMLQDRDMDSDLRSQSGAPILTWSKDPKREFIRVGYGELAFFLAIDLIGLVSLLLSYILKPRDA